MKAQIQWHIRVRTIFRSRKELSHVLGSNKEFSQEIAATKQTHPIITGKIYIGETGRSFGTKDENGQKKSRLIPPVFLYLSRPFSYLRKNMEMGREAGRGVSRPYLRDPVFSRNNPVFFPYL